MRSAYLALIEFENLGQSLDVPRSKLPLFSYGRDGHQPNSRGLYTHYKDSY